MSPIRDAIFLDNLSIWVCQVRFSSINTPSDLTEETRFFRTLLIESSSVSGRVLNLCLVRTYFVKSTSRPCNVLLKFRREEKGQPFVHLQPVTK